VTKRSREPGAATAPKADETVVLFLGDASIVDPLVHALVGEHMETSSQSLDFETFRFGERPIADIAGSLRQVGMFSPKRAVWLRSFAEIKRKGSQENEEQEEPEEEESLDAVSPSDQLLALLEEGVPAGTLLVVSAATLDQRGRLYKWLAKNARVVDRRMPPEKSGEKRTGEGGMRRAIADRLEELGVTRVGDGVVEEIARRSGSSPGEALQEIDRLVLAQSDPSRLERRDVQAGMRDLALGWVFDFTNAIEKRDLATAETLIARLIAEGEPPIRLCAVLASHVAKLVQARPVVDTLPRGWARMKGPEFLAGPGASLPDSLRGWPGFFRLRAAAEFRPDELRRLHGEVRRLDAALKSSSVAPLLLFSRMLHEACIR
jgi:DNA polymerase III delta subunit